jgi:hypothetical protein
MPLIEFNRDPSPREVRQFARVWLPAFCLALALWATLRLGSVPAMMLAAAGLVSLLLGMARPAWLRPFHVAWMAAAYPIGWLLAHLLLAAIYFLLITPIGLILRLARRDPLARRIDRETQSYWTPRANSTLPEPTKLERYFRQF